MRDSGAMEWQKVLSQRMKEPRWHIFPYKECVLMEDSCRFFGLCPVMLYLIKSDQLGFWYEPVSLNCTMLLVKPGRPEEKVEAHTVSNCNTYMFVNLLCGVLGLTCSIIPLKTAIAAPKESWEL